MSFSSSFQERGEKSNPLEAVQNVSDVFQGTMITPYSFHTLFFIGFPKMAFAEASSTDEDSSTSLYIRIRRMIANVFRWIASFFRTRANTESDQEKADTYQERADLYDEQADAIESDIEMDKDMKQCKLELERVRIQRNKQLLLADGVKEDNIKCLSHPEDTSSVQSWYTERARGLCYDKTRTGFHPSLSNSIGPSSSEPPKTPSMKRSYLKVCQQALERLRAAVAAPPIDREMAQCKLEIERVRMKRNRQLLTEAGVDSKNIKCFSHSRSCMFVVGGRVCRPSDYLQVESWYIERAGGVCYDDTGEKPSFNGMGSEGRTPLTTEAEKKQALEACKTNLALLEAEVASSPLDRKMAQCKSDIEQVRIKRNKQLLLAAGVKEENIECFSHRRGCMWAGKEQVCRPSVSSDVKSWYTEKAWGVCYDKTGTKPANNGMGPKDQAIPETEAEKEKFLKGCETRLAQLKKEVDASDMDREMAQCKLELEELRIQKNKLALLATGTDSQNIECFEHPKVCMQITSGEVCRPTTDANVDAGFWYAEKVEGICYDKTGPKPSDNGMGADVAIRNRLSDCLSDIDRKKLDYLRERARREEARSHCLKLQKKEQSHCLELYEEEISRHMEIMKKELEKWKKLCLKDRENKKLAYLEMCKRDREEALFGLEEFLPAGPSIGTE